MARSHLQKLLLDQAVGFLKGAQVAVVNNGTSTLVSQILWKDPLTTVDAWPNPFTTLDGTIDFYLDAQQTVSLLVTYGSKTVRMDAVQVLPLAEEVTRTLAPLTITDGPGVGQVPTGVDSAHATWADQSAVAVNGLPVGGTTGQVLAKNSGTDFDTVWENAPSGGGVVVGNTTGGGDIAIDSAQGASGTSVASGINAIAMGLNAQALANQSIAIGSNDSVSSFNWTTAKGTGDVVIGQQAGTVSTATDSNAVAIGQAAFAGRYGVSIGGVVGYPGSTAKAAHSSVMIGNNNYSPTPYSVVIGMSTCINDDGTSTGFNNTVIGANAVAGHGAISIKNAVALGAAANAGADSTVAIGGTNGGTYTWAGATGATAIGVSSTGSGSQALGTDSIAMGGGLVNTGATSGISIGRSSSITAAKLNGIAIGQKAAVQADYGIAIGSHNSFTPTRAGAAGAIAIGVSDTAVGAVATGIDSIALGGGSGTLGDFTLALGGFSTAGAAGKSYGVALGYGASSTGTQTIAVGYNSNASADYAIAIGHTAAASASGTIAIGHATAGGAGFAIAIGDGASATGAPNLALGSNASAGGFDGSVAIGTDSAGAGAAAGAVNEFVLGTANHTVRVKGVPQFDQSQTTVGAAGAASALPATPVKYLKIKDSTGTTLVIPAYNP